MPGPDQVIACPHCEGLARYMTLMSGNTFGARGWTDGKQDAPMLPRPPALVKCRYCGDCYWLADAREVGTVAPWDGPSPEEKPEWRAAKGVQELSEEDFYRALGTGLATGTERERTLRILAWWRRNDAFRDAPDRAVAMSDAPEAWRKNLQALVSMLGDRDVNERLMKAEALRELGDFEAAMDALGRVRSRKVALVVKQLRSLCEKRDPLVRELQFGA